MAGKPGSINVKDGIGFSDAMQLGGIGLQVWGAFAAYGAQKQAYQANARNIMAEAEQDLSSSIKEEMIQRVNQGRAISAAQTVQASSGFDGSGTADTGERSASLQFEQAIDNQRHAQSVAYAKQKHAAEVERYKVRLARKSRNLSLINTAITAGGMLDFESK